MDSAIYAQEYSTELFVHKIIGRSCLSNVEKSTWKFVKDPAAATN